MRGTSAEAEQRPAQSERLSKLSESLPEWRIRRSGGGAERFVAPFVTIAAEPDEDATEAVASEARRPRQRATAPHRRCKKLARAGFSAGTDDETLLTGRSEFSWRYSTIPSSASAESGVSIGVSDD